MSERVGSEIKRRSMSDLPFSDKMDWVWTTLNVPSEFVQFKFWNKDGQTFYFGETPSKQIEKLEVKLIQN